MANMVADHRYINNSSHDNYQDTLDVRVLLLLEQEIALQSLV